jgi:hypothetical protein
MRGGGRPSAPRPVFGMGHALTHPARELCLLSESDTRLTTLIALLRDGKHLTCVPRRFPCTSVHFGLLGKVGS